VRSLPRERLWALILARWGTDTGSAWTFESVCDLSDCVAVDMMVVGGGAVHAVLNESEWACAIG
jgi:hypothetical protein